MKVSKTVSNCCGHQRESEIPYAGQVFNLDTKCVTTLYDFKNGTSLRHKYKLWNELLPISYCNRVGYNIQYELVKVYILHWSCFRFLERAMQYSFNHHRFKNIELNTQFNTESVVLKNFFNAVIYLAFKFDAAVMAAYLNEAINVPVVHLVMENTIQIFSRKAFKKLEKLKGKHKRLHNKVFRITRH